MRLNAFCHESIESRKDDNGITDSADDLMDVRRDLTGSDQAIVGQGTVRS